VAGIGSHLVTWRDGRNLNGDIYGQRLSISGGLQGGNIAISNAAGDESRPVLAWSTTADHYLVVWQHDGTNEVRGQRVAADGTLAGAPMNLSETGAAARPAVTTTPGNWAVVWQEGDDLYGRLVSSDASLEGTPVALVAESGSQSAPAVAPSNHAGQVRYFLAWQDGRSGQQEIYSGPVGRVAPLQKTIIEYDYDPLYRLTEAVYTDAITATYSYVYDAVGNMMAYTETVGTATSSASRTFDPANRLQTAFDSEQGTSSYYFDNAGNLVEILPPGADGQNPEGRLRYGYDQRNLLITSTLYVSGTGEVLQAEFIYDGAGNRVQQVDHSGGQPVTTTYTNDVVGLAQVLVADDGTTQTANLFGLSLIHQDDGDEIRTLLSDGLGSVRQELVAGAVESTTTYEPYGNLLARTGASGTDYGFTGEQQDRTTGLIYLRARYYNPAVKAFISADSFQGFTRQPISQHSYVYTHNNPVNYVDPSGHCIDRVTGEVRMNESPYGTSGLCRSGSPAPPPPSPPPPPPTPTPPPTITPSPTYTPVATATCTPAPTPSINTLILGNPFGPGKRSLVVADYGGTIGFQATLGGGQGIGHPGVDLVTLDYALESKQNGYIAVPKHRALFSPASGTIEKKPNDHMISIVVSTSDGDVTIRLIHVDSNRGLTNGSFVQVGQPLNMDFKGKGYGSGSEYPHLHLELYTGSGSSKVYVNPLPKLPTSDNAGSYWTFRDPSDGLYFSQLPYGD
jgi:RHS repeat-associated protein